ncbi:MAG: hypothetical protein INF43_01205 [Alphaproteobacteria bacterium]|nr:hypothetical protein [Alphaproteobacteria bacterium]
MLRLSLATLLLLFGTLSLAGWAQGVAPIRITAAALNVDHAKGQASFEGNVKVVRADLTLTADRLEARYGEAGLGELTARTNVVITRTGGPVPETATGAVAVFNPAANTLTLTGPQVTLTRGPSRLQGDKLVYNLTTQQARVTQQGGPVQATFTPQ